MRGSIRRSRGQNFVEYLLLVIAVTVVMIAFFAKGGKYSSSVNGMLAAPMNMLLISNSTIDLQPVD